MHTGHRARAARSSPSAAAPLHRPRAPRPREHRARPRSHSAAWRGRAGRSPGCLERGPRQVGWVGLALLGELHLARARPPRRSRTIWSTRCCTRTARCAKSCRGPPSSRPTPDRPRTRLTDSPSVAAATAAAIAAAAAAAAAAAPEAEGCLLLPPPQSLPRPSLSPPPPLHSAAAASCRSLLLPRLLHQYRRRPPHGPTRLGDGPHKEVDSGGGQVDLKSTSSRPQVDVTKSTSSRLQVDFKSTWECAQVDLEARTSRLGRRTSRLVNRTKSTCEQNQVDLTRTPQVDFKSTPSRLQVYLKSTWLIRLIERRNGVSRPLHAHKS